MKYYLIYHISLLPVLLTVKHSGLNQKSYPLDSEFSLYLHQKDLYDKLNNSGILEKIAAFFRSVVKWIGNLFGN